MNRKIIAVLGLLVVAGVMVWLVKLIKAILFLTLVGLALLIGYRVVQGLRR